MGDLPLSLSWHSRRRIYRLSRFQICLSSLRIADVLMWHPVTPVQLCFLECHADRFQIIYDCLLYGWWDSRFGLSIHPLTTLHLLRWTAGRCLRQSVRHWQETNQWYRQVYSLDAHVMYRHCYASSREVFCSAAVVLSSPDDSYEPYLWSCPTHSWLPSSDIKEVSALYRFYLHRSGVCHDSMSNRTILHLYQRTPSIGRPMRECHVIPDGSII